MNRRKFWISAIAVAALGLSTMALLRNKALVNNTLLNPTFRGSAYGQEAPGIADTLQRYSRELNEQEIEPTIVTFAPTWGGFSSDPTGNASYINLGDLVVLWLPNSVGTTNATSISITGIPSAIRPPATEHMICMGVEDGTLKPSAVAIQSTGTIAFFKSQVSGSDVTLASSAWTSGVATNPCLSPLIYPL